MKINKHKNKALQSILNESKVNYKGSSIKMQPQAQNNAQNKNLELNESHNEKVKDKNGRDFSIWTECSGGSSTQSDYIKIAYLNDNWMDDNDKIIKDNLLGYLEYSVSDDNEDKAYVQMIEIKDSERRKGIAGELIKSLQKEYKDINYGYTTKDGTELLKGLGIREKLLPNENDVKIYYFKSPYDAKNFLLNQKEPQRVYIDKQLGIYLIGDMYDTTHQYMIDNAKAQFLLGKYYDWSDYNDNQLSLLYVPNGSDFDESSDAIGDYYDHKYTYDDFIMYDRYHDFDNFELANILGKHISQEAKLTNSNGYNVQDRYKFESLKEGNNYGYHAGDLGKSEQRERQTGGRGTGHFGTGTYFVGNPEKIKGYNDYQYGKGEAPHHIVDFSSYNLYKPSNSDNGYKLHDALSYINNGYAYYNKHSSDYDWFISKNITGDDPSDFELKDIPEIVSHLNNLLFDYDKIELPNNINWETISDEYDKLWDELYDKYKSQGYKFSDAFDKVDSELNENPIFKEKNRVAREVINGIKKELDYRTLNYYKELKNLPNELLVALEGRHSKEEIQNALNEVNKHLDDKQGDSLSTIFMKALGYDGVDTRNLNGLDNTTYGSVIYDVKPETIVEQHLKENLNEAYAMSDRIRKLIDKAYDYCRQAGWDFDNPQTFKSNMLVNCPLRISIGNETSRRLGQARYPKNDITEIVLAPQIDKFENDESILSVILHELGHIIAFDDDFDRGYVEYSNRYKQTWLVKSAYKKRLSHHGKRWQDVVAKLSQVSGIPLQRLANAEDTAEWQEINKDKYKYFFECPRCHSKLKYTRETDFVRTYNDTRQDGSPYWWCGKCEKETGEKIKYVKLDKEN